MLKLPDQGGQDLLRVRHPRPEHQEHSPMVGCFHDSGRESSNTLVTENLNHPKKGRDGWREGGMDESSFEPEPKGNGIPACFPSFFGDVIHP